MYKLVKVKNKNDAKNIGYAIEKDAEPVCAFFERDGDGIAGFPDAETNATNICAILNQIEEMQKPKRKFDVNL